jgi:hypothetical protein
VPGRAEEEAMKFKDLAEKLEELEARIKELEEILPDPSPMEIIANKPNPYMREPLDKAYDPPRRMDLEDEY